MRILLIVLSFIVASQITAQEVVKALSYRTHKDADGVSAGGVTTANTLVLTSMKDDVQITGIVNKDSKIYKRLKLDTGDTLTINIISYRPYHKEIFMADSTEELFPPLFDSGKHRKMITFGNKSDMSGLRYTEDKQNLQPGYIYLGNEYDIEMPERIEDIIIRP
ncbi:MAG: hypothetical protein KJ607_09930 [Bacteroidetes bacterium]|nr:hypothetical protein [Bacteroidota bacterium]